tara:strand:- start:983 stop:1237 length:255 start_codon:yes stop_codon:yes gene_type:complete
MARQKSDSGAYMSQYDTEVEKRLAALEAQAHEKCDGGSDGTTLTEIKKSIIENSVPPAEFRALKEKIELISDVVKNELRPDLDL